MKSLFLASLLAFACSSGNTQNNEEDHGPPGGIIEVDPSAIGHGGASAGGAAARGGASNLGVGGGLNSYGGAPVSSSGGVSATNLGLPCDADSDCGSGLKCHTDYLDYVSHGQCTLDCDRSDACDAISLGSFCIGAHVCVRPCDSNADCVDKTRCIDAGWCERTGPGSGVPYCAGTVQSCASRSSITCITDLGCFDDSHCDGVATQCSLITTSSRCTLQPGCTWSSASSFCSGTATCTGKDNDYSCNSVEGCSWSDRCLGSASECSHTPVSSCSLQPGCSLRSD